MTATKIKKLIILFVSMAFSFGLVILSHAIFDPIKKERDRQEMLDEVKVYYPNVIDFEQLTKDTINGVSIELALKVYGKDETPLGYLYIINAGNSFGNIKLRVLVNLKDRIDKIEIVELNQTMYQSRTQEAIKLYVDALVSSNMPDVLGSVTSVSLNTLISMMKSLGVYHDLIEKFPNMLPYKEYFGDDYEVVSTEITTYDGAEVKVETIKDKGYVYTVTKSGIYNSDSDDERPITLILALDLEGKIIGGELPSDLYKHSGGNYRATVIEYLESFFDGKIQNVLDDYAGASDPSDPSIAHNSRRLVHKILVIIREVYPS